MKGANIFILNRIFVRISFPNGYNIVSIFFEIKLILEF